MSHPSRPAAKSVAELIGGAMDPLLRKRGLARAEILSWWPDIVGEAYAQHTAPDHIRWPRDGKAATLFVRCDPAIALQFSYESDRVRERLNGYFGYAAVGQLRVVQTRMGKQERAAPQAEPEPELSGDVEGRLTGLEPPLREALRALGRQVLKGS